jgi:deoxyguanosine kinase
MKPFIVLEGTDGSGKSSLCDWIEKTLNYKKYKSIGGPFADIKNRFDIDKVSIRERFSFLCGEAINNAFIIKEQLKQGNPIIFDRYYYSTLVYCESLESGVSNEFKFLFENLPKPDIVFFIQTDFETMLKRITNRGDLTLIEKKYSTKENFDILNDNYKKYIDANMVVIDNNESIEIAQMQIKAVLNSDKF